MPYCRLQACAGQSSYTCKGQAVMLQGNAMDGEEPYRFKWMPATGLDNPNIQNPVATLNTTTRYILVVTDARNCTANDTITVTIYDEPDNTITPSVSMPACPCESVTLTAPPGLTYKWSTGDSTRSITVNEPGIYGLEVSDLNGCTAENQIVLTQRNVNVTVTADTINDASGKEVQFFLHAENEQNLFDCGYSAYTAKISYNASLLIPRKDTPFGNVVNGIETITVSGDLANASSQPLNFYTLWGNAQCTDISIDEIQFNCDSVKTITVPGRFCLTDLCDAAGLRLFDNRSNATMSVANNSNGLNVRLNLEHNTFVTIALYTYTGELVESLIQSELKAGAHEILFDTTTLTKGVYFLILTTTAIRQTVVIPVY